MHLRVAHVIERTEAEGPGHRFAVWVQGCPIRCPGCCNPEMFPDEGGTSIAPDELAQRALSIADIEGISLLGGEPFAQPEACARLATLVRDAGLSVMVFSGYTRGEILARGKEPGVAELMDACDLLVDGRYERDLPESARRWIGSKNQVMHFLSSRYAPTDPQFRAQNTAEIRFERGQVTMNGWPPLVPQIRRTR